MPLFHKNSLVDPYFCSFFAFLIDFSNRSGLVSSLKWHPSLVDEPIILAMRLISLKVLFMFLAENMYIFLLCFGVLILI